jgi:hypothetical protein
MSEEKRQEFKAKVKAVHDAVNEYAEGFPRGDWFPRGLDNQLRNAVEDLLSYGVTRRPITDEERRRLTSLITPPPTKTVLADTKVIRSVVKSEINRGLREWFEPET